MDPLRKSTDRGATPYFHGRKPILDSFKNRLRDDKKNNEGTIFLVQGPPGIGKSALLDECRKKAKNKNWEVRKLVVPALWDPDLMAECLGLKKKESITEKTVEGGGEISTGVAKFKGAVSGTTKKSTPKVTPRSLIQKIKNPLLLILDEAQHLGEDGGPPQEHIHAVKSLLTEIHNGELGKPVILLAGGLGMTHAAFRALGISRMADDCMFDMEPLKREEERAVVQDWLGAGKAKGDTTAWIDAITQETYLWPRHVDSYARNAAQILKANGGRMTPELLRLVMENGRARRWKYYQARLDDFTAKECRSFARILLASSGEGGIEQEVAVDQLDNEYGAGKGAELFFRAVRRGVFHIDAATKLYSAPIPSLREYIVQNFPPKEMDSPQYPDMGLER